MFDMDQDDQVDLYLGNWSVHQHINFADLCQLATDLFWKVYGFFFGGVCLW